jgi:hypothetical protein
VKPIQPIIIERQGNQWVKVTGYSEPSALERTQPATRVETTNLRATMPDDEFAAPPRDLPPAVLVFRDGHVEQIGSYTIIGNILYAKSDYWASGEWTRKIEIASLDVPATLKLNQEHGSNFRLPSGPREVMIRP